MNLPDRSELTWTDIEWGDVGGWVSGIGTLIAVLVTLVLFMIEARRADTADRRAQQAEAAQLHLEVLALRHQAEEFERKQTADRRQQADLVHVWDTIRTVELAGPQPALRLQNATRDIPTVTLSNASAMPVYQVQVRVRAVFAETEAEAHTDAAIILDDVIGFQSPVLPPTGATPLVEDVLVRELFPEAPGVTLRRAEVRHVAFVDSNGVPWRRQVTPALALTEI